MQNPNELTRRSFLQKSAAALTVSTLAGGFPMIGRGAASEKTLKVVLVGCGGRGMGAAHQALTADKNVTLSAVADIFQEKAELAIKNLSAQHADKVSAGVQKFVGLDAIDKVLETDCDVVLLTTPPGFRPEHFEKCVAAGKHTFCEKPCATDATGIRRFMEAAKVSRDKHLGVQSGFCWRSSLGERAVFEQIQKGAIGQVRAVYGDYLTGTPWVKPRKEEWSDLEWQLRNWPYFTWLSGDHLVEQAVHSVDKMSWAFGDVDPVRAIALGGRQQRVEPEYGQIYDHFGVMYEYPEGGRGFIFCRQQAGTFSETTDHIIGSKGSCDINGSAKVQRISGETTWRYQGPSADMYQTEHDEFFASIRAGNPLNFADKLAHSTMVAILGRMAAYSGQSVTWEDAMASKEVLAPAAPLTWDMKLEVPAVAMPGRYKLL